MELSSLQWGSSFITLNPVYGTSAESKMYTPITNTVAKWGPSVGGVVAEMPGCPTPVEYYYYT